MKLWKWPAILFLLGSLCLAMAFGAAAQQRSLSGKLIRLHVVANSDAPEDQAVKLLARDRVMEILQAQNWQDRDEAAAWLTAHEDELRAAAEAPLPPGQTAAVTLSEESFSTRRCDAVALPAGRYLTLRIRLGAGEGHNWWCVVYPALCASAAGEPERTAKAAGLDDGEIRLMTGDTPAVRIRFRLLEWLNWEGR